jgi:hypothetical protein
MQLALHLAQEIIRRIGLYEAVQLPLTLVMLAVAIFIAKYPIRLFDTFEDLVGKIAQRPFLSAALIAGAAIGLRAALSPFIGIPQPTVPDEFSLLLQAGTYLGGHLANHVTLLPDFESVFVIISPSYASMYPVLRSFPILAGYWLGIGAWGGVFLSMVVLTLAVYWMVREWINARYAIIAALIVIIRFGLFSLWINSYWGGAFTALGGVLLVGGYKAVTSRPSLWNGIAVGLGVAILMTTRPYEGMFYSIPFGAALLVHFFRSTAIERKSLIPAGMAAIVLAAAGFGLTVADNQAVTGDWKVMPYSVYFKTTAQAPPLLVQSRGSETESTVRYARTRYQVQSQSGPYDSRETWRGILSTETFRFRNFWNFYVGFALLIPFAVGVYALRREPALLFSAASLGLGLSLETWTLAHYAAPIFGFVILAIMFGFKSLREWKPSNLAIGLSLSRVLPLALVLGSVVPLSSIFTGSPAFIMWVNDHDSAACCWLRPRSLHESIARELDRYGGRNLIIVENSSNGPQYEILVSNGPDIDKEKTIWINDDPEFNRLAIERYPGRRIWRLGFLDDGAPCLRLFKPDLSTASNIGEAFPGDAGRFSGDPNRGWFAGSAAQCPGGLTHAPWPLAPET